LLAITVELNRPAARDHPNLPDAAGRIEIPHPLFLLKPVRISSAGMETSFYPNTWHIFAIT
jgi:hypothetical protein